MWSHQKSVGFYKYEYDRSLKGLINSRITIEVT